MSILFKNADILAWENGDFKVIRNGYLAVEGDTIAYVGADEPAGTYTDVRDMTGKLLMPGLINCHCHAAMTLLRGVGSDLPLQQWLFGEVIPIEDKMAEPEFTAGTALAMMEMIASGITSYSDMYMKPVTTIELNEQVGMKVNLTRVIQSFDPNMEPEDCPNIGEAIDLYEKYNGCQNGRVRVDFGIHAEYTATDKVIRGFTERIAKYIPEGTQMQIHLSETATEQAECVQRHGLTPAQWCESLGVFDTPTGAAHCVHVTDEDIAIMKKHGVSPIHNPSSNMKLGSGFAPIPKMLAEGLNVCLGTDGAASNNNLNFFEEMHLAAVIHNGYHRDAEIMKPSDILKMATVNGAKLQGREDTGKLQAGMKADIIALDFSKKPHLYPNFDPMAMCVYSAQASDVCMTMVDGRVLYEDGKYLTLDPEKVMADAKAAVKRLYGKD